MSGKQKEKVSGVRFRVSGKKEIGSFKSIMASEPP
jgi:hypothetical protein